MNVARGWTTCVIAAPGPSLTPEVAARCEGQRIIAVNRAYLRVPFADVLYCGDRDLIELDRGFPEFSGEKWTVHEPRITDASSLAARYGFRLVPGARAIDAPGFALAGRIHYGNSSGFQAINLALLFGATEILLVGFDMRTPPRGQLRHFHPDYEAPGMNLSEYERFHGAFKEAARLLPPALRVVNCTPGSALRCFPMMDLDVALAAVPA